MCAVQVIEKDANRGWFSEGGKTVIHVSAEEAGSVKLGGDFKSFVNEVALSMMNSNQSKQPS